MVYYSTDNRDIRVIVTADATVIRLMTLHVQACDNSFIAQRQIQKYSASPLEDQDTTVFRH